MKIENRDIYTLSPKKEKELWKKAIIVFDSSALLDFYYYPEKTRKLIAKEIFENLKTRLWITSHIEYEYLKNRMSSIEKVIKEKYDPLKQKVEEVLDTNDKTIKLIEQIKKDTFKTDRHPHLNQTMIERFIKSNQKNLKNFDKFSEGMAALISKKEKEILQLKVKDTVLDVIQKYFKTGDDYKYTEILEIVKEGELRFKFKIPPGYEDEKDKIGTQIFGDLIIWKQTIDLSKKLNTDIIFITNDLKEDWCHKDSRNRITSPREELVKELYDQSKKQLWMYNQSQFIYKSKEYLKVGFDETKIEEISSVINHRNRENLIYECDICGSENSKSYEDIILTYDEMEQFNDDNGQGVTIFTATDENECHTCRNVTEIKLAVATYNQDGEYFGDFIELDKGQHIRGPNHVIKFLRNEYEMDFSEEPDLDTIRNR